MDGANNVAFSNIIYASAGKGGIEINEVSGFQHDYNIVSRINGGTFSAHESNPDASSVFVNAIGNDYHLKSGSPAVDAGVGTFAGKNAPSDDLEARARPQGMGFDMGAYEVASVPIPTDSNRNSNAYSDCYSTPNGNSAA